MLGSTVFSSQAFSLKGATFLPGRSLVLFTALSVINQSPEVFMSSAHVLKKTRKFSVIFACVFCFSHNRLLFWGSTVPVGICKRRRLVLAVY